MRSMTPLQYHTLFSARTHAGRELEHSCTMAVDVERWVVEQRALLELERLADLEESAVTRAAYSEKQLEMHGVAIRHLYINETKSGLCGRTLIEFSRRDNQPLPASQIGVGDIVQVGLGTSTELVSGIVSRSGDFRITVSFDEYPDIEEPLTLVKLANEVTFKRYRQALDKLAKTDQPTELRSILFGHSQPSMQSKPLPLQIFDAGLNGTQVEAVNKAMASNEIFLIHGPPGTGKTTAVVEVIRQAVARGDRVLACAASNIAVDNMVERLAVQKVRVCRVGHPARLLPDVVRHSLDYMVQHHDNASIVDDIRNDMSDALSKMRQRGMNRSERLELRTSMKQLRKELSERESKTTEDILMHSQVVACTLTGSAARDVFTLPLFDLVVIDEAAQALESACWIALLKGKRAVLAGDHKQLPPTIKSHQAESGLGVTLFDRLATLFGGDMMHMLTTQYRMNEAIMQWSSNELYDGKLVAADSVKRHRLCDLPGVKSSRETITPFVFVDTAGCNLIEADDSVDQSSQTTGIYSMSKRNEGEASIVCKHVRLLVAVRLGGLERDFHLCITDSLFVQAGLSPSDISVITPYNAQVDELRQRLSSRYPGLEIGSVDGFQGREKEAIVISLVRSNPQRTVGFLAEDRRINVALTRARRHLCVVGDSDTISSHPFLARLLSYAQETSDYRSGQEYQSLELPEQDEKIIVDECDPEDWSAEPGAVCESEPAATVAKTSKARISKAAQKKQQSKSTPAPAVVSQPRVSSSSATAAKGKSKIEVADQDEEERVQFAMQVDDLVAHLVKRCNVARRISEGSKEIASQALEKAAAKIPLGNALLCNITATSADFVPSLNSFQRLIVHEVAERASLEHVSTGVEPNRFIRVSTPKSIEDLIATQIAAEKQSTASAKVQSKLPAKQQVVQQPSAPIESVAADELEDDEPEAALVAASAAASKPSKAKEKKNKKKNEPEADVDLDELLATMNIRPGLCAWAVCKKPVKLVGMDCPHCHARFCFEHGMAEIHGCGTDAKRSARADFKEQAALQGRSTYVDPNKRAQLHRKLEKQIDEKASGRQVKKDEKKK